MWHVTLLGLWKKKMPFNQVEVMICNNFSSFFILSHHFLFDFCNPEMYLYVSVCFLPVWRSTTSWSTNPPGFFRWVSLARQEVLQVSLQDVGSPRWKRVGGTSPNLFKVILWNYPPPRMPVTTRICSFLGSGIPWVGGRPKWYSMCAIGSINSHCFPMVGDGKNQPKSVGVYILMK